MQSKNCKSKSGAVENAAYVNQQTTRQSKYILQKPVESFEYLVVILSTNGKADEEINNRIHKANKVYYQLSNAFMGSKEISGETKSYIYKTAIIPTLLYATEKLTISTKVQQHGTGSENEI